jgi:N-acetylmuramoyl-L-alanine amidase
LLLLLVLAGCGTGGADDRLLITYYQPSGTATVFIPGMPPCPCECPAPPSPTIVEPTASVQAPMSHGKVVAVDPGHGGKETGAVAPNGLEEKNVNLRIALELAARLRQGGFVPVLTRDSDRAVNTAGKDLNSNGVVDNDDDLQARVDIANAAHADIVVSIHNDSSNDLATHGTTTYYCEARPFAAENIRLATVLQAHLVSSIRAAGYNTLDHGISDDAPLKKPFGHLFLLGPLTPRVARASTMPGALGETLYLSNPTEARLLANDTMLSAIARGYYEGIVEYFGSR